MTILPISKLINRTIFSVNPEMIFVIAHVLNKDGFKILPTCLFISLLKTSYK